MARGRPPKPVQLKKLKGTYRADRDEGKDLLNFGEIVEIEPPADYDDMQKEQFKVITSALIRNNILQEPDLFLIYSYCDFLKIYHKMRTKIDRTGLLAMNKGKIMIAPEYKILKDSLNTLLQITAKLGISPVDRMKFINLKKPLSDDDPVAGEI